GSASRRLPGDRRIRSHDLEVPQGLSRRRCADLGWFTGHAYCSSSLRGLARGTVMMKLYGRLAKAKAPGRLPAKRSALERRPVPTRDRNALHTLVIDSLAEQIAIIDRDANIVDVNAAWRRFAREGRLAPELLAPGGSYLDL